MSTNLTRRSLVAAAPAAVVAATLPALAAGNPDVQLLALREPYERTFAGIRAAGPAFTRAEEAIFDALRMNPPRDRAEVEREVGFDVAEAEYESAVDANTEVLDQIAETPALTLEGLLFKACVCARADYYPDLADAIIDDLVAMGGHDA